MYLYVEEKECECDVIRIIVEKESSEQWPEQRRSGQTAVGALAVCAHCHDAGLLKRRASRAGCPCPCLALCCDRTDTRSDWYVRRDARWATEGTTRNA